MIIQTPKWKKWKPLCAMKFTMIDGMVNNWNNEKFCGII